MGSQLLTHYILNLLVLRVTWFHFSFSQKMSSVCAASVESAAPVPEATEQKKPLKPCCACPETKKVRDAW